MLRWLKENVESAIVKSTKLDAKSPIIRNVKVLGSESQNRHGQPGVKGTIYTREALSGAVALYEGAKVYIDHPDRQNPSQDRSLTRRIGQISNVKCRADGLYGDLRILESHPHGPAILEASRVMPNFGLSHNAMGDGTVKKRHVRN